MQPRDNSLNTSQQNHQQQSDAPVLFNTVLTDSGKKIGVVTLNMAKALNALNFEMMTLLAKQLTQWKQDSNIVCVLLEGAGDKAFCAGGDVRAMQAAAVKSPAKITKETLDFFTLEYQVDFALHQFGKPVIVWGDGIVMGGGLGLMMGASHRIITERSKMAMPEVTIGLYPDVGGSYFLNKMPDKVGLFLGLTGYLLTPADAAYVTMANYYFESNEKNSLINTLLQVPWADTSKANHELLNHALKNNNAQHLIPDSQLANHQQQINQLMAGELNDIIERFTQLETDEKWLARAKQTLLSGSPLSWYLIYQQSLLCQSIQTNALSLADCFRLELGWSVNCCAYGDFAEGVRALLIDKDKSPQWKYQSLAEIPANALAQLMNSPWQNNLHPLKNM